jgi:hypothetical protein
VADELVADQHDPLAQVFGAVFVNSLHGFAESFKLLLNGLRRTWREGFGRLPLLYGVLLFLFLQPLTQLAAVFGRQCAHSFDYLFQRRHLSTSV